VNSLSFAGIETFLLPDAAYPMSEEDVVMWNYFFTSIRGASQPWGRANRGSLRQAQGRLFDCASRDKTARGGGRDDSSSINRTLIHPVLHGLPLYV
jgi:hypothetical protein